MYIGVKKLISLYKKEFNREVKALKKAKANLRAQGKKASEALVSEEKELVLAEWSLKAKQGTEAHEKIVSERIIKYPGSVVGSYKKVEGEEIIPAEEINKLEIGKRYYEKMVVDNQNMILGYADEVNVDSKGYINIEDFKTFKDLKRTYTARADNGFTIVDNFFYPVNNLIDCNFIECALQASFYMYMLWMYNQKLKPGKLTMLHTKLDEDSGNIVSKEVIELPYLLEEVKLIIQHQKESK